MRFSSRSKLSIILTIATIATVISGFMVTAWLRNDTQAHASGAPATSKSPINCASNARTICTEVYDSEKVFGKDVYIGHDEPSNLFYSNRPGSGNQMRYTLTLPRDPAPTPLVRGKS